MFKVFTEKYNLPKFRVQQLNHHFYQVLNSNFDEFTNFSLDVRENLKKEIPFSSITVEKTIVSLKKDTIKFLFRRVSDKALFETVLMIHQDRRNTVCVSCMIGCPVGCKFCATGKMGFKGNLTASEIIDQVLFIARTLKKDNKKISNIVFMGMGEPLLNFENVWEAILVLTDPQKFAMSPSRITISTSGFVKQIEKLISLNFKGNLAVSLHASNQQLREKIMPSVAKLNPLDDLLDILSKFRSVGGSRITFEYILIKDFNDSDVHAEELSYLLHNKGAHVNLIPYNRIPGEKFETPSKNRVRQFSDRLSSKGINNTIRITMGADVNAACGQLAGGEDELKIKD